LTEEETTPEAEEAEVEAVTDETEVAEEVEAEAAATEEVEAEVSAATEEIEVSEEAEASEEPAEAEEVVVEAEAAETKPKSDLPPGADLEPIAVEPEAELDAEERARLEAEAEEKAAREAALVEESSDDAPIEGPAPVKIDGEARYGATGKRKRSVARVTILPGDGQITINGRDIEEYFPRARHRTVVNSPLVATGYEQTVEVRIRVHGGGISGQAGAVRHGIARALTEVNPELRSELKRRGFLTRDSRAKERRKAGLKKARKRPQFSKR
jgi:small subunit ribosomal protein S9